jgi:hypothetical protein
MCEGCYGMRINRHALSCTLNVHATQTREQAASACIMLDGTGHLPSQGYGLNARMQESRRSRVFPYEVPMACFRAHG